MQMHFATMTPSGTFPDWMYE